MLAGVGLRKLTDFQASLYKETAGSQFDAGKYAKLLALPPQCSHILAIGMKRVLLGFFNLGYVRSAGKRGLVREKTR